MDLGIKVKNNSRKNAHNINYKNSAHESKLYYNTVSNNYTL